MSRLSRRQFLEDTLFATAAAAVGVRSNVARADEAATGRKVGANEQLRVACIGFHGQGRGHIGAYAGRNDVTIAMLCDTDKNVWPGGLAIIEKKGKKAPRCVQDLRRVFDDKSIDYDLWSGPAPLKPPHRNSPEHGPIHYDWHWFWDYGNGDLGNQGIHQMDLARWAIQKDHLPESAITFGGRFGYKDDGETPNTEMAFMDYGDTQLIFETRGLPTKDYKGAKVGNVFHGTKGYVVMTSYTAGAAFDPDGKLVEKFQGGGDHFGNFINAVRSRKHTDLHADILEGHLSSALCHLANISYRLGSEAPFSQQSKAFGDNKEAYETFERTTAHLKDNRVAINDETYRLGRKLAIDAKNETFPDDPQARALLTREYRAPFVVPQVV